MKQSRLENHGGLIEIKRLNCGIAMLQLEVGAVKEGFTGEWEYLTSPQIAEFKAKK